MTAAVALESFRRVLAWPAIEQQLDQLYQRGGLPRGDSTGWVGLEKLYTVAGGQWTLVTGVPGMGKSEWVDALIVNLASRGDWTFGIFSPENHPVGWHVTKLIEKRIGKPFNIGPTERMGDDEYAFGKRWVRERFTWLKPESETIQDIVPTSLGYARSKGKKHGVVIDPWNMLDHYDPYWRVAGMSETEYVSEALSCLTRLLRSPGNENVHVWLIAHPAKLYRGTDGKFPMPTGYDISGSAHWFNKADNIICINRDKKADTQDVDIAVQKIRFKHIGMIGSATLKYDRVCGRYFELGNPGIPGERYAAPAPELPPLEREPGSDDDA